jgi:hypothetical protein
MDKIAPDTSNDVTPVELLDAFVKCYSKPRRLEECACFTVLDPS